MRSNVGTMHENDSHEIRVLYQFALARLLQEATRE